MKKKSVVAVVGEGYSSNSSPATTCRQLINSRKFLLLCWGGAVARERLFIIRITEVIPTTSKKLSWNVHWCKMTVLLPFALLDALFYIELLLYIKLYCTSPFSC